MDNYIKTIVNGLKAWVSNGMNRVESSINSLSTKVTILIKKVENHSATIRNLRSDIDGTHVLANSAYTRADNAYTRADNASNSDILDNKVAGETEYIIPPQTLTKATREAVSGGYRYPITSNAELNGRVYYSFCGIEFSDQAADIPEREIKLTPTSEVIEVAPAIRADVNDGESYIYLTSKYVYTRDAVAHIPAYHPFYVKKATGTIVKKLPAKLSPHSAGDGIEIAEDGTISADIPTDDHINSLIDEKAILTSPGGSKFKIVVSDDGALTAEPVSD